MEIQAHDRKTQLNNERILLNAVLSTMDKGIIEYKVKGKDGFKIVMPASSFAFMKAHAEARVDILNMLLKGDKK